MRNKIIIVLLMLTGVVSVSSCTKTVIFTASETKPRLVLYSLARPGNALVVEVSSSLFTLKEGTALFRYEVKPTTGTVKLYVNDSNIPITLTPRQPAQIGVDERGYPIYEKLPDAPIHYLSDYVVQPGDHLRLVASFRQYDDAEAEIDVPVCPSLTIDKVEFDHPTSTHSTFNLTLTLEKGSNPKYYYRIIPFAELEIVNDDGTLTKRVYSENKVFSNDIIFQSTSYSFDDILDVLDGKFKQEQIFADASLSSSPYTFNCGFGAPPPAPIREKGGSARYYLRFVTISKELYLYMTSYEAVHHATTLSQLTEAPVLYSNVKGGFGCFCACDKVEIDLGI